ncbi:E motif [Dillenia turbinata]|uniref:E motif n=1 Tax=Dillenia turbinata TaxID=194707 RepID=A0AAN8WDV0_9MAGN
MSLLSVSITSLHRLACFVGGSIFKFLPSLQVRSLVSFAASDTLQVLSNGTDYQKIGIDFKLLFPSCNKLHLAKCLHALLLVSGEAKSIFFSTRLVTLYASLGDLSLSRLAFDHIRRKDVFTWNTMISCYVRNGCNHEAICCCYQLLSTSNFRPDFYTFPPVLKACSDLVNGKKLHCWVFKLGFEMDVFVAASLIHMYSRFGSLVVARQIFDDMEVRDMGSWNAMISGVCQYGNAADALSVLDEMRLEGINMDPVTVSSILPVCAQLGDILTGMLIHLYVIKHGLEDDLFVSNAMINMYAKFGLLRHAKKVFHQMLVRDVVSWNSIISAYEQKDDPHTAFHFFSEMQLSKIWPDSLTLVSLASIVSQLGDCRSSRSVHGYVLRRGWVMKDIIMGNAIIDMYAKLGATDSAHKVFKEIPVRDVVSWNTLITGYAQNGLASEAIEVYGMMEECMEIIPNQGTWVSILPAYAHVGALQQGMRIHGKVFKAALHLDVFVGTCLIDMYAKCGRVDDAMSLFSEVPQESSVPWNAMISCHGVHGDGVKALNLFREMLEQCVKPDHVTFVSLLSACSHSGLVDQGQWFFHLMQEEYGVRPSLKHYGCMVDMLGRAGQLEKAYEFIKNMPIQPDASIWGALLSACRIHGNADLGSLASNQLFEVDSENVGYYVLLSNIYANARKWEGVDQVRSLARDRGLRKTPGWTSIEVDGKVDVFYTGNQSHPQCGDIYKELEALSAKMKSLGYIPDYSFVLQDVDDEEKEHILRSHSERLAIAFGIISTPPRTPLRIFKNLRMEFVLVVIIGETVHLLLKRKEQKSDLPYTVIRVNDAYDVSSVFLVPNVSPVLLLGLHRGADLLFLIFSLVLLWLHRMLGHTLRFSSRSRPLVPASGSLRISEFSILCSYFYLSIFSECRRSVLSTRDNFGHDTHTSSAAARSPVPDAESCGYAKGTSIGIAPMAWLAMYKVLFCDTLENAATDTLAGIEAIDECSLTSS